MSSPQLLIDNCFTRRRTNNCFQHLSLISEHRRVNSLHLRFTHSDNTDSPELGHFCISIFASVCITMGPPIVRLRRNISVQLSKSSLFATANRFPHQTCTTFNLRNDKMVRLENCLFSVHTYSLSFLYVNNVRDNRYSVTFYLTFINRLVSISLVGALLIHKFSIYFDQLTLLNVDH